MLRGRAIPITFSGVETGVTPFDRRSNYLAVGIFQTADDYGVRSRAAVLHPCRGNVRVKTFLDRDGNANAIIMPNPRFLRASRFAVNTVTCVPVHTFILHRAYILLGVRIRWIHVHSWSARIRVSTFEDFEIAAPGRNVVANPSRIRG